MIDEHIAKEQAFSTDLLYLLTPSKQPHLPARFM